MNGPAWEQVGPSSFLRSALTRRQVGKIENLINWDFFRDVFRLAGVADGVGHELGVDAAVGGFDLFVLFVNLRQ
jgi:hypothetical protein